jgi:hypothetical protein
MKEITEQQPYSNKSRQRENNCRRKGRMAGSNSQNMEEKQYKHKKLCAVVGKIKVYIVN